MTDFFTADTHFGHSKIIEYCQRPFCCVTQMDESLIENWNDCVGTEDTVYHLGDFGFGNPTFLRDIRSRLNGKIILILGNHDFRINVKKWLEFVGINEVHSTLEYEQFILSHLPHGQYDEGRKQDRSQESSKYFKQYAQVPSEKWRLCGHVHKLWIFKEKQMNVGVDVWNYKPISAQKIFHSTSADM